MGRLRSELDNKVAAFRAAMGLTQEQLAQAVHVSRQTIVALEGGLYSPSTVLALRLSILLDTTVNNLFQLPEEALSDLQQQKELIAESRRKRQEGYLQQQ
jgi:putative transcriptional regulator